MYVRQINTGTNFQLTQGDTGCCPEDAVTICKTEILLTDPVSVASVTIDGTEYPFTWVLADGMGALITHIATALNSAGYVNNTDKPSIDGYINTHEDPDTWVIRIYSNIESLTISATADDDTVESHCIKTTLCRFEFEVEYNAAVSIIIDDPDANSGAGNPQTISGDFQAGDGAALATEVEDETIELYANEDNMVLERVRVTEDAALDKFKVELWLYGRRTVTIDDVKVPICECRVDYTAAQA